MCALLAGMGMTSSSWDTALKECFRKHPNNVAIYRANQPIRQGSTESYNAMSWRMRHFVVIGEVHFEQEHSKFWSNSHIVSGWLPGMKSDPFSDWLTPVNPFAQHLLMLWWYMLRRAHEFNSATSDISQEISSTISNSVVCTTNVFVAFVRCH